MATPTLTDKEIETACAKAEIAIEKILIDLENETGRMIGSVNVDTRNFANCNTEIFFE